MCWAWHCKVISWTYRVVRAGHTPQWRGARDGPNWAKANTPPLGEPGTTCTASCSTRACPGIRVEGAWCGCRIAYTIEIGWTSSAANRADAQKGLKVGKVPTPAYYLAIQSIQCCSLRTCMSKPSGTAREGSNHRLVVVEIDSLL